MIKTSYIITLNFKSNKTKTNLLNKVFSEYEYFYGSCGAITINSIVFAEDADNIVKDAIADAYSFINVIKQIFPKEDLKMILYKNPEYYTSEQNTELKYYTNELMRYSVLHEMDSIIDVSIILENEIDKSTN